MERDGLSSFGLGLPPTAGAVFAFTNTGGQYPYVTYNFSTSWANRWSGQTFDAVVVLLDDSYNIISVSNVDRLTVQ